jgi:hypothetical protein
MTAEYVSQITAAYPAIREVWLIGSRANSTERPDSDWDYLAFADDDTLADLSQSERFNWPDMDLLVVADGVHFFKPWIDGPTQKNGSLVADDWNWKQVSRTLATYTATKIGANAWSTRVFEQRAIRVYPSPQQPISGIRE